MTKVLILGGGPAGYVAAGRAAQLGASVTLVEEREIGGTCLNRGCIPTKAMIAGADRLRKVRAAAEFGIVTGEVGLDFATFMTRKEQVTETLRDGVVHLLKARKVEVVAGRATLAGPGLLRLADGDEISGDAVILATGSEPVRLPVFDWQDRRVMTSDELLRIDHVPPSLVIAGGGIIGCEFASVFATLGSRVTIVELLDQLVPGEDRRVARTVQQAFKKAGIEVLLKTAVETMDTGDGAGELRLGLTDGRQLETATVLVAVGRRPVSRGLGYEEAGVKLDDRGFVVVDETLRTTVDRVFAAGDLTGPMMLAHWAYHQGAIAAENAVTGGQTACDRKAVPSAMFSSPEVAVCGLNEEKATAEGYEVDVAHVRLNPNSKAVIEGEPDGYVRIVCDRTDGRVLGANIVGLRASELIHELTLAIHAGLPLADVMTTIHAHPTLSESVGEAALSGHGRAIHSL
jgi:dihydrolipoamide dehydrogenase